MSSSPIYFVPPRPIPGQLNEADQIRRDVANVERLAAAAEQFLLAAFPHIEAELVTQLTAAWAHWYNCDAAEEITAAEHAAASLAAQSQGMQQGQDHYLVQMCSRRDMITSQIEAAEAAVAELPVEGMGKVVEATMIMPLRQQLADCEEQIRQLQNHMERAERGADIEGQ